jgi:hypothetical protein
MRHLDCRGRHVEKVELLRERINDDADVAEVPRQELLPQRGACELEAARPQVRDGGHRCDLDLLLRDLLDASKQPMLARLCQCDRSALAAGPARPANAVHV